MIGKWKKLNYKEKTNIGIYKLKNRKYLSGDLPSKENVEEMQKDVIRLLKKSIQYLSGE